MKKILIIGNRFDLAHNKLTNYSDFLDFICKFDTNSEYADEIKVDISKIEESSIVSFLKYYYIKSKNNKNWIDMESELCNFINNTISLITEINNLKQEDEKKGKVFNLVYGPLSDKQRIIIDNAKSIFMECREKDNYKIFVKDEFLNPWKEIDIDRIIKKFEEELDDLIVMLCFYLKVIEPKIREKDVKILDYFQKLSPDKVISFNYTDTIMELYGMDRKDICYIHGRLEDNNIVLGYSDFLQSNTNIDIIFKKYFQRIKNKNDKIYDYITYDPDGYGGFEKNIFYFFGHSLDVSDKDLLIELFNSKSYINVYYYDEKDRVTKLKNIFKLLGKDNAEERFRRGEICSFTKESI